MFASRSSQTQPQRERHMREQLTGGESPLEHLVDVHDGRVCVYERLKEGYLEGRQVKVPRRGV